MKNVFLINPETEMIPDAGIGNFIEGYSRKGERVNYYIFVMILIPVPGLYFVIEEIIHYFKTRNIVNSYYLYTNGFIYQKSDGNKILEQEVIDFNDCTGVSIAKTRTFTWFGIYNNTVVRFRVLSDAMKIIFDQTSSYENKKEDPHKYNICGTAFHAIIKRWNDIAIERFNHEFSEKGYGTFYSENGDIIQVGKSFIKVNSAYADANTSKFGLNNGLLYIYRESVDGGSYEKNGLNIDVNNMFNSQVFLIAIHQLLGLGI